MATGRAGRWFLLPGLVFLFAIDLIPLAYSAWVSFYNWWLIRPRDIRFVGLANYTRFADDPEFTRAVIVTIVFTVGAVLVEFLAGLGLALLSAQPFRFLRPIRVLLLLPLFVVPVVGATMWRVIFHPELGVLNYYLGAVGLGPLPWLSDPRLALVSITLVDAWRTIPFMFLVMYAGLEVLPSELSSHHGAAAYLHHAARDPDPRHGRLPRVRHHLRAHGGRPRDGDADDPDPELSRVRPGPHGRGQRDRHRDPRHRGRDVLRVDARRAPPAGSAGVKPTRLRATLTGAALVPVLVWTLFPIYWITTASFKTELALYAKPPQWLFTPILDNYTRVLTNIPFSQYLKNSLVVAIGTTLGSLVLGTLAGYGFARFRFRASEAVRFLVLVTRMAPRMVLVVPYYLMMQRLGLLDTYTGLLVAYVSFALPFSIWLLIGFFVDVPLDVEEAAMIDGCSRLGVLIRIVIPIAAPGLVVAAIFAFLVSWNEFLFALILSGVEAKTLPVVIAGLNTDAGPLYGEMSAAAVMVMLPNIVMTLALQRYLVRGLALGAVKG